MKKFGVFLLAFVCLATGCKNDEMEGPNNGKRPDTSDEVFTAIIDGATRTYLGDEGAVVWDGEDMMTLFKKSGYVQKYTVLGDGGTDIATLRYYPGADSLNTKSDISYDYNYAVYPHLFDAATHDEGAAAAVSAMSADGKLTVNLTCLAEQSYTDNPNVSFENGKALMTAKSDNTSLPFNNALAMLRLNLCSEYKDTFTVKEIRLKADQPLHGSALVDMSLDKPYAVIQDEATAENTVTKMAFETAFPITKGCGLLGLDNNIEGEGGHDFYLLLPQGSYTNFTVEVDALYYENGTVEENPNENELHYAMRWDELEFTRNKIKKVHRPFSAVLSCNDVVYATVLEGLEAAKAKGEQELNVKLELGGYLYWPFFEAYKENIISDIDLPMTIDGENKTLILSDPTHTPTLFSSNNQPVTLKNITFKGTTHYVGLGHYIKNNKTPFDITLENVTFDKMEVLLWAFGAQRAAITAYYGTTTFNNCTILGSKTSDIDPYKSELSGAKDLIHTDPAFCYDILASNSARMIFNGGSYGTIFTYEHAALTANDKTTIDYLYHSGGKSSSWLTSVNNGAVIHEMDVRPLAAANGANIEINEGGKVEVLNLHEIALRSAKRHIVFANGTVDQMTLFGKANEITYEIVAPEGNTTMSVSTTTDSEGRISYVIKNPVNEAVVKVSTTTTTTDAEGNETATTTTTEYTLSAYLANA